MSNECLRCRYFRGYYSKTYCGFYMEKFGQCYKHDKICGKHESCESYETRINKPAIKRGVVIDALSDAIRNIETIKNILVEREIK